jgi:hypothetical protein
MIFHKIFLQAGRIETQKQMRMEELDPTLLRYAEKALLWLHSGARSVSNPVPDGPEMAVELGSPHDEWVKNRLREDWIKRFPEADIREYEDICKKVQEHNRRTSFHFTYRGKTASYTLVHMDCDEGDGGLYGSVAGSSISGSCSMSEKRSEYDRKKDQEEHEKVVREIVALKPAFITPSMSADERSVFCDYFAAAMLFAETASAGP